MSVTGNERKSQDWLEVAVEVAGIDAETVADTFRPHCPGGVAIELATSDQIDGGLVDGDGPALVRGYLPPGSDSTRVRRALQLAIQFAPLQTPPRWRRSRRLPERRWRDAWKRYFRPQRVGKRLLVKPSWTTYRAKAGDTVIEIDPGMAFGTGQHPTTVMCLRALERLVRPGAEVLDVGTGSGVLAIAAAKLGARRVLALDIDPQAVKAARSNVAANGVGEAVEVRDGGLPDAITGERFDAIVANISGQTIELLAEAFEGALRDSGVLIASGFLEDAVAGLSRVLSDAGLEVERAEEEGVWRTIVARRAASA